VPIWGGSLAPAPPGRSSSSPAAGIRAELVEVDLTELDLGRRFDLVGTVNAVLPAFDAGDALKGLAQRLHHASGAYEQPPGTSGAGRFQAGEGS
jgi:hypothetical protein